MTKLIRVSEKNYQKLIRLKAWLEQRHGKIFYMDDVVTYLLKKR